MTVRRWIAVALACLALGGCAGVGDRTSSSGGSAATSPSPASSDTTSTPADTTPTDTTPTDTTPTDTTSTDTTPTDSTPAPTETTPTDTTPSSNPAAPSEEVGSYSHADDAGFCSAHTCIGDFQGEGGYIVECQDGTYSHAGGISGACSHHGGEQ